jgi:hypothetical protein
LIKNKNKEEIKKDFSTTKNRAGKSISRVNAKSLHYSVFTMFWRHDLPEDLHLLTKIVKDILTPLSNKHAPIITPKDKLNSEVASLITSRNATTLVSSLFLEDNVGEDGISSQSTYKNNIYNPYCFTPISRLLFYLKPPISLLNDAYGTIMKVLDELRVKISLKKTLLVIDCQRQTINTNIAEVQAKDVAFPFMDDDEFVDWTSTNKFAKLRLCEDIHLPSILKQAIVNAINKSPDSLLSIKLIEDESKDQQNQFVRFVSSHTKSNLVTLFHIHSFAIFHTDLQFNTIVTCILEQSQN